MQKRNNQTEILPNYFLFSLRCYSILSYGSKIHCSSAKIWWKIMLHKKYSWTCRKYPLFMIKPLCFTLFHPSSIVHITKFHRSPAQGALPQDCEAPALWGCQATPGVTPSNRWNQWLRIGFWWWLMCMCIYCICIYIYMLVLIYYIYIYISIVIYIYIVFHQM